MGGRRCGELLRARSTVVPWRPSLRQTLCHQTHDQHTFISRPQPERDQRPEKNEKLLCRYLEGGAELPGVLPLPVELSFRRGDELLELGLVLSFLLVQYLVGVAVGAWINFVIVSYQ